MSEPAQTLGAFEAMVELCEISKMNYQLSYNHKDKTYTVKMAGKKFINEDPIEALRAAATYVAKAEGLLDKHITELTASDNPNSPTVELRQGGPVQQVFDQTLEH